MVSPVEEDWAAPKQRPSRCDESDGFSDEQDSLGGGRKASALALLDADRRDRRTGAGFSLIAATCASKSRRRLPIGRLACNRNVIPFRRWKAAPKPVALFDCTASATTAGATRSPISTPRSSLFLEWGTSVLRSRVEDLNGDGTLDLDVFLGGGGGSVALLDVTEIDAVNIVRPADFSGTNGLFAGIDMQIV